MSSETAIVVRKVGKRYTLRHNTAGPTTLGEAIMGRLRGRPPKIEREQFWALRQVSFDVRRGEVLGLVGANGAGKSTLLKILSRVTEMTEGEVELYGRVGSLLEVGTGFHQELTGRENIFLNGAILGMTRAEIRQQFDAIVDFAGVEKFLDTPVKHYSSGMYVRLAFAVAAHLRTEILIADEVLAVGDQEFQRKCLGKMREVATDGRTVLLVSHNMTAISGLCTRALLLRDGRLAFIGDVSEAVAQHSARDGGAAVADVRTRRDRAGNGDVRATKIGIFDARGNVARSIRPHERFQIVVSYDAAIALPEVAVSIDIEAVDGTRIATLYSGFRNETFTVAAGAGTFACEIGGLPLRPDTYSLNVFISARLSICDFVERVCSFEIAPVDVFGTGHLPQRNQGALLADYRWRAGVETLAAQERS